MNVWKWKRALMVVGRMAARASWNNYWKLIQILIAITGFAGLAIWAGFDYHRARGDFNGLTPAENLAAARSLKESANLASLHEARDHLQSLQTAEAAALRDEIDSKIMKLELAEVQAWEQEKAQKAIQAAAQRNTALNALAAGLKSLGYDFTAEAIARDTISFTSPDFDDTVRRVAFLSLVRDSDATACQAGFENVQLVAPGWRGFSETYSLNCPDLSWWQTLRAGN
jgi:hypothetical protein